MAEFESAPGDAAGPVDSPSRGLDVRIAQELVDRARAEGVSLVGQGGLLSR